MYPYLLNTTTTNGKNSAAVVAVNFKKLKRKGEMRRHREPGLIRSLTKG
ncbi:hypothetical protein KKB17_01100 [bacterium]|nr:hypothetical protein [bacterium]